MFAKVIHLLYYICCLMAFLNYAVVYFDIKVV